MITQESAGSNTNSETTNLTFQPTTLGLRSYLKATLPFHLVSGKLSNIGRRGEAIRLISQNNKIIEVKSELDRYSQGSPSQFNEMPSSVRTCTILSLQQRTKKCSYPSSKCMFGLFTRCQYFVFIGLLKPPELFLLHVVSGNISFSFRKSEEGLSQLRSIEVCRRWKQLHECSSLKSRGQ